MPPVAVFFADKLCINYERECAYYTYAMYTLQKGLIEASKV